MKRAPKGIRAAVKLQDNLARLWTLPVVSSIGGGGGISPLETAKYIIRKQCKEAEEQYNLACERATTFDELDRLEKNYKYSLKLLKIYKEKENKK